jgi:hypothetical protein
MEGSADDVTAMSTGDTGWGRGGGALGGGGAVGALGGGGEQVPKGDTSVP